MKGASRTKVAFVLICGGIGACALWLATRNSAPTSAPTFSAAEELADPSPSQSRRIPRPAPGLAGGDVANSNQPTARRPSEWRSKILQEGGQAELPRETLARWITLNRTNAESLLAARQAGGGQEYLLEALRLYPDDPRVLYASITLDDSAEAKRERLDRFKTICPDNALPYYLSAREHLKQAEPDMAVNDLMAASGLTGFEDYTVDAMQSAEELYLSSGASAADAKVMGGSSVPLPHLAQLKDLTTQLMDLRQQYLAGGDPESADNVTRAALHLGDQLASGSGSRFAINQLVGAAIQQIALNKLEPDRSYDFLPGGVAERKAQVTAFKEATKQDAKTIEQWLATANEDRVLNYFERIKLYGERTAVEWVKNSP